VTVGVLDRLQRKYPAAGYPLAVVYKFFEFFEDFGGALPTHRKIGDAPGSEAGALPITRCS
jgi:hypothetical protein